MDYFKFKKNIYILVILLLSSSFPLVVLADWSNPTANPPGNNTSKPLNVGDDFQFKTGSLRLGGNGNGPAGGALTIVTGNVGIGTTDAKGLLHIEGTGGGRGHISLLQNDSVSTVSTAGLYWHTSSNYSIHKTDGPWSSSFGFQQLMVDWPTGIILNPGQAYLKSYVEIQGTKGLRIPNGSATIGITVTDDSSKLHLGGNIDMHNHNVINLANAVNNSDALPKGQADTTYAPISSALPAGTTNGETLRYNGTSWVANTALTNNGTNIGIGSNFYNAKLNFVGNTYTAILGASRSDNTFLAQLAYNGVGEFYFNTNLGIGTVNPGYDLDVYNPVSTNILQMKVQLLFIQKEVCQLIRIH